MACIRLTSKVVQNGLRVLKKQYEMSDIEYIIEFKDGEYGRGQISTKVSVINLLSDAIELLEEKERKEGMV